MKAHGKAKSLSEQMTSTLIELFPGVVAEHRFCERDWRFDWAWPEKKLALEQEGGVFIQGRHTRGKGFMNDMDKYNTATLLGWRILRVTPGMWRDGRVIKMLEWAFKKMETGAIT